MAGLYQSVSDGKYNPPDESPTGGICRRIGGNLSCHARPGGALPPAADPAAGGLAGGEWVLARNLLAAVGLVLDAKARRAPDPAGASALAERYRDLTAAVLGEGGEPLRIEFSGDEAAVLTRNPATLEKERQRWIFVHGNWARSGQIR